MGKAPAGGYVHPVGYSGVIGLVVDPAREETREIVRRAFGDAGLQKLHVTQTALPGSFVAMVGRILREPARVGAFHPKAAEVAVAAVWDMAQTLGDSSCWVVNLPDAHQDAVLAMLAQRSATTGPMQ